MVALRIERVTKRFGALVANDAISLSLQQGEVLALLGENGAGKTTLVNIIFGHYAADAGKIEVFGKELPAGSPRAALAAGIGMVHQHFTLADNLTVMGIAWDKDEAQPAIQKFPQVRLVASRRALPANELQPRPSSGTRDR